jgi:hypothetical protein
MPVFLNCVPLCSSPDGTTSHSAKLSKNDSQVAGYDKGRLGGVASLVSGIARLNSQKSNPLQLPLVRGRVAPRFYKRNKAAHHYLSLEQANDD